MSNRVLISADCVCDIPVDMAEEMNVSLMYYYIITEEGKFRDMTEIRTEQVLEYMELDGKKAHSTAAKTEDYREYFAGLRKKTENPIIHLCMSQKLSRGYGRAVDAAKSFSNIYVVDSRHISGGMGHLVFRAAEMANAGACVAPKTNPFCSSGSMPSALPFIYILISQAIATWLLAWARFSALTLLKTSTTLISPRASQNFGDVGICL